jgi:hypothetical protein
MNTDEPIWISISPSSFPIRITLIEPIKVIFLQNGSFRAPPSQRRQASTAPTATIAVFWNGFPASCPKTYPLLFRELLSLKESRDGFLLTSKSELDCFAIPVARFFEDSIELACANPIKLAVRVQDFTLEGRQFSVDVKFCENSEVVERSISAMLGQEVRLDPSVSRKHSFKNINGSPIPLILEKPLMFRFQEQTKAVSIDDLTVAEIEARLSQEFGLEVEIDWTAVPVTRDTVLFKYRRSLPSPIRVVPLAKQFCRISICRKESSKPELHQFLKSTTIGEIKVLLCPDARSREIEVRYEEKLLSDDDTLDRIRIHSGCHFCLHRVSVGGHSERNERKPPWDARQLSLNAARRASGDDRLRSGSEFRFHFGPNDDVVLKFDSSATVEDACIALSDIRNVAFPPLALFCNGNELNNRGELLSFSSEIYVGGSLQTPSQYVVELPDGFSQQYERKPIRDLRQEIGNDHGVDVDLVLHGMLLRDSEDLRDKYEDVPIVVIQRPRGDEVVVVEHVFKYNFAVQGHGPMLLELGQGVGIDYVKHMFGYLADNAPVKLYAQGREIETDEALEASVKVREIIQIQWNCSND